MTFRMRCCVPPAALWLRATSWLPAALLLLALGASTGCQPPLAEATDAQSPSEPGRRELAEPVPVGTTEPRTMTLATTQPGRLVPFEVTLLFPKVSGYVQEVLVDIGDAVERDQVLLRLEVPELADDRQVKAAQLRSRQAQVRQAAAAIQAAQAAATSAEAAIEHRRAGVARAEAEHARWEAESTRLDDLARRGSISQKVADETRNQFLAADAARQEMAAGVRAAEAAYEAAAAQVAQAEADLGAAEAQSEVAAAELHRVETMLRYLELRAPFDGTVVQRSIDPGHLVADGRVKEPLLTVARTDRFRVVVDVPEVDAAYVRPGNPAVIRVPGVDVEEVAAEVVRSAWALEAANRSLRTEIDVENNDPRLRPGMYVTVSIDLETREDVPTLPEAAVLRQGRDAYCFAIRDGRAVKTPIKLGLRVEGRWQILSGVSEDQKVALAKTTSLSDGQPVRELESRAVGDLK